MHRRLILTLACLLAACKRAPVAAQASPAGPAHVYAGTVERGKAITSSITGVTYPFHLYLPAGYATSDRRYPVLYSTDAQWSFPAFSRMLDQRGKPMILVGIEQGGDDRRAIDFKPDGAPAYARFLKEELVPLIERSYRTTGVRSYTGTSLGGLLGALMLSTESTYRPFFSNYLLFDGSFGWLGRRHIEAEEARLAASHELPVKLILTGATHRGNAGVTARLEARYKGRPYRGLQIFRKDFDVDHESVGDPSFDWAIDLVD
ncbi:MAG TPA: alpha/beta hydrolase-fold protein [Roseateles sp.]